MDTVHSEHHAAVEERRAIFPSDGCFPSQLLVPSQLLELMRLFFNGSEDQPGNDRSVTEMVRFSITRFLKPKPEVGSQGRFQHY
jgi:hypothetical protein